MESKCLVRLRREDCERTKHDSAFSNWKVLIGPNDWENYSLRKEGSERYRVHNLPKNLSPGVYELGIAAPFSKLGHEISKLDSSRIVPAYLGQADNVRTRLQQYGRSGAHLSNSNGLLTACTDDPKDGLFKEAFSKGYSIVYRWAPMNNKEEAQTVEAQLLKTFDYAWNKGSNGARRPNDVFKRLNELSSQTKFSRITRKILSSRYKRVGIEISRRRTSLDKGGISYNTEEINSFLPRIFKISRTHPQLVPDGLDCADDVTKLCGVALDEGSVCKRPPVIGRKRCEEHKGMRTNIRVQITIPCEKSGDRCKELDVTYDPTKVPFVVANSSICDRFSPICGVMLDDGSYCKKQPARGRKRCTEHKGMRINGRCAVFSREGALPDNHGSVTLYNYNSCETSKFPELKSHFLVEHDDVKKDHGNICGVDHGDGTFCTRQPARGRVRCEDHKGMRIKHIKRLVK